MSDYISWKDIQLHAENLIPGLIIAGEIVALGVNIPQSVEALPAFFQATIFVAASYALGLISSLCARLMLDVISENGFRTVFFGALVHADRHQLLSHYKANDTSHRFKVDLERENRIRICKPVSEWNAIYRAALRANRNAEVERRRAQGRLTRGLLFPLVIFAYLVAPVLGIARPIAVAISILFSSLLYAYAELNNMAEAQDIIGILAKANKEKDMNEYSKMTNVLRDTAKQVRNHSAKENPDLWTAYCAVGNILYTLVEFGAKEPEDVSDSCSHRISLTANMVQSFYAVEDLITSGAYWSASAVLRQHMETLSRIIEYRKGKNNVDKKPPNVRNLPFNMAPNYGRLSELCHTSGGEVLGHFSECEAGEGIATPIPKYRKEWAKSFFSLHIAHMLSLALEIWVLQNELYPNDELPNIDDDLLKVSDLLVKTGFWKELNGKS
jgi:hypothetical protein